MDQSPPEPTSKKDKRGGARKGSGRPGLTELNLIPVQTRMSLPPEAWELLDYYAKYRDGLDNPKKYPERHRMDVIRDIILSVLQLLNSTGLTTIEQAKLTKSLDTILKIDVGGISNDE